MTELKSERELVVVMPVYNEAEVIGQVLREWHKELERLHIDFEIHIYNDGSKDATAQTLQQLQPELPRLRVVNKSNSGHGPTILQGYKEVKNTTWVFQTDSDNEMPASAFSLVWEKREGKDAVFGARDGRAQSFARRLITYISRAVVWLFYGKTIKDVNAPYRLLRLDTFEGLFAAMPHNTLTPNLIITGFVAVKKLQYLEVRIPHEVRKTGKATATKRIIKMACNALIQVIRFRFSYASSL